MSLVIALSLVAGCYTLQPAARVPEVGTVVALDVNDVGRMALGNSIGPEVGQIEGRLISQENGEYLLAVSTVRFLRGGEQIWSGERVRVNRDHVGNSYERRFSKGRTIALGATVVAGVAAIVATSDLIGLGREPTVDPDTNNQGTSIRMPRLRKP